MAIYEERKLLLQGSDPIKLFETKDRQEVTCVQNSFFSCIIYVSSRNVALDLMHNSMQLRAACALKDLLEPISMTSSEIVGPPYCSRPSTFFKPP